MDAQAIRRAVSESIELWRSTLPSSSRDFLLSPGALNALVQMIVNIQDDPSVYWREHDPDQAQRRAINVIPNALNDIFLRGRRNAAPRIPAQITSWEIWHGLSRALEVWCPIPKEF